MYSESFRNGGRKLPHVSSSSHGARVGRAKVRLMREEAYSMRINACKEEGRKDEEDEGRSSLRRGTLPLCRPGLKCPAPMQTKYNS